MKAFRSKISSAAGRIKDGIERSVLAEEPSTSGGRTSRRGSRSEAAEDDEETFVRLPLESAKRLRCFAKGDVGEIIARHLKEKEELLGEILALRDLCLKCAPNTEVKLLVDQSKAAKVVEVTRATNTAMVLSLKDEMASLRAQGRGEGLQGSDGGGSAKKIAALEWKLEELESEVTMLREEATDYEQENESLQQQVSELKSMAASPPTPSSSDSSPLESTVEQLKQDLAMKTAECKSANAKVQSHQRKAKEIQRQYKLLKEKQKQLVTDAAAVKEEDSKVCLQLKIMEGHSNDDVVVVKRLEYEIEEMRTAHNTLLEAKAKVESELKGARSKVLKLQKVGKNQKAKIEKMQLDLAHEKDKTRGALEEAKSAFHLKKKAEKDMQSAGMKLEESLDSLRQEKKTVEDELESARRQLELNGKLEEELADTREQAEETRQKLASASEVLQAENGRLEDELSNAREEIENLKAKGNRRSEDVAEAQTRSSKLEEELASAREELDDTRQQLASASEMLQAENGRLEEELASAREEIEDLKAKEDQEDMMDKFCRLLVTEDRSTWSSPLVSAAGTVEERAAQAERRRLDDMTERERAKTEELGQELEERTKELQELKEGQVLREEEGRESLEAKIGELQEQILQRDSEIELQKRMVAEVTERLDERRLEMEKASLEAERGSNEELAQVLEELAQVREELKSVRNKARMMMEAKDKEIQASKARMMMEDSPAKLPEVPVGDPPTKSEADGLTSKLEDANKLVLSLQDALADSERTHELRDISEQVLKEEIQEMRRNEKRGKVDVTYVKNVLLKGFESGELDPHSSLVTVLSRLLEFSPEELKKIPAARSWKISLPDLMSPRKGNHTQHK